MNPAAALHTRRGQLALLALPGLALLLALLAIELPAALELALVCLAALVPAFVIVLAQRRAHAAERARMAGFTQRLIDVMPQPVYVKDSQSRYLIVNRALCDSVGKLPEELIGQSSVHYTRPDLAQITLDEDARVLDGARVHKELFDADPRSGLPRHRIIIKSRSLMPDGRLVIVGTNMDATASRKTEQAFEAALEREIRQRQNVEAFVQRLVDVIPDPVYVKNGSGNYLLVNSAYADYCQRERAMLTSPDYPPAGPPTLRLHGALEEDQAILQGADVSKEECVQRRATGETVYRVVRKRRSLYLDGSPVIIGIYHDVTRWRVAEQALSRLAEEDALTGIANRRHFEQQANAALQRAHRLTGTASLILIDLDHFKQVNDQYGHQTGDQVLVSVARRLADSLRRHDIAGRWGGEEFIVLLPETGLAEARQIAERLCRNLAERPLQLDQLSLPATLSAGVAEHQAGEGLENLIARADACLYAAKQSGRNCVRTA